MSYRVKTPGVSTTDITTTTDKLVGPLTGAVTTVISELKNIDTTISTFETTHTLGVIHKSTGTGSASGSQTVLLNTSAILDSIENLTKKFNDSNKDALVNKLGKSVDSKIKDKIKTEILDVLETSIGVDITSLKKALKDVKSNLDEEKEAIIQLLTSIKKHRKDAGKAELETHRSKLETNVSDLIYTATSLVSLKKGFEKENLDLKNKIIALTKEVNDLTKNVSDLTDKKNALDKDLSDLRIEKDKTDTNNSVLNKRVIKLEKDVPYVDFLQQLGTRPSFDFGSMQRVYSEISAYSKTFLPETPQRTNLMYYNFIMILVTCLSYACFWCNANRLYTTPAISENFNKTCGTDQQDADSILGLVMSLDWIRCYITMLILPSSIVWYNHYIEDMDSRAFVSKNKARICAIVYIVLILFALFVSIASIALFIVFSYYSHKCVLDTFPGLNTFGTQMVSIWVPFALSLVNFGLWLATIVLNRFFFEKSDETSAFRLGFEAVFLGFYVLPSLYSTKKQDALFETHKI